MSNPTPPTVEAPQKTAERVARSFFRVTNEASRQKAIRQSLLGAFECAVLIPSLFYLRFGKVGPLGWGTTVFFIAYCFLSAVGLYFQRRTEYHSPIALRGDWLDRVGAFWLVGCAFGPLFGWIVTTGAFPVTLNSWRWLYGLRVFLAAGVPILLALPLTRYVRGKSTWVALPLLVCVTLLPISSAMNVSLDLWEGPLAREAPSTGQVELYLKHTERSLSLDR